MSLFPAFINARKRQNESSPTATAPDSHPTDSHDAESDDNIFSLLPPESSEAAASPPKPQGRNRHPVEMTDLSRLSIDRDGRLYWDGKPVEVHRRIAMSRAQIVGASIVAAFVAIGSISAMLQGAVAARDLSCRLGWSSSACPAPAPQPPRPEIPA